MGEFWKTPRVKYPYWELRDDGLFYNVDADNDMWAELSPQSFYTIFDGAHKVDETEVEAHRKRRR